MVIVPGENDLATKRPEILNWWDDSSSPSQYSPKSAKEVNWKCPSEHKFKKSIKRFNFYCNECSLGVSTFKPEKSFANKANERLLKEWSNVNEYGPERYSYNSAVVVTWECSKKHIWESAIYSRYNGSDCKDCSTSVSNGESELANFIKKHVPNVLTNTRSVLPGSYELDIYVPDLQIAFEYNGLYWHSEKQGKDKTYHHSKWKMCKDLGIRLISIWENQWINKNCATRQFVESCLMDALSLSTNSPYVVDELVVLEVNKSKNSNFLNTHIPSQKNYSDIHLSCEYRGKVIGVSNWSLLGSDLNILDFVAVTNKSQVLRQMIIYMNKRFPDRSIFHEDDHLLSESVFYENFGFKFVKELPPKYLYFSDSSKQFISKKEVEGIQGQRIKDKNVVWTAGSTIYQLSMDKF